MRSLMLPGVWPKMKRSTLTEIEALAVIWAIKKFRHYLLGREFVLVTDHHALCLLQTMKDPKGKLGQWLLELSEHRYKVIHKSGVLHVDADALSRCPLKYP